jgi:plasmid maintenance system antidote protein VapI
MAMARAHPSPPADMAQLHNPHPGEILKEEFLKPIGMSQNQLAHAIGVPGNRESDPQQTSARLTGCKMPAIPAD